MCKYSADLLSIEKFEDDPTMSGCREGVAKLEVACSFISLTRLSDLMRNILKLETLSSRNAPAQIEHPLIASREILELTRQDQSIREWVCDQENGLAIGSSMRTHALSTLVLSVMKEYNCPIPANYRQLADSFSSTSALILQLWSPHIYVGA
jgi:hypothetical protein